MNVKLENANKLIIILTGSNIHLFIMTETYDYVMTIMVRCKLISEKQKLNGTEDVTDCKHKRYILSVGDKIVHPVCLNTFNHSDTLSV